MNSETCLPVESFIVAARQFCKISDRIGDGWRLFEVQEELHKSYLKKDVFEEINCNNFNCMLKAEYVIFYNLSYGVPSFSFNVWNSSGVLMTLEDIRRMSLVEINQKDFYSVITQQEHPIFFRPYFVMHPCHTATLLAALKDGSRNIIVTFLGLITPLLKLNLSMEYGR